MQSMPFTIQGFQEAIASVSDLDLSIATLTKITGWQLLHRGQAPQPLNTSWQLDLDMQIEEAVLGAPGEAAGHLRLVQFHGAEQVHIRSNAQTWDTGGILDLNVRVQNLDQAFQQFQTIGWQGVSDPVEWQFGSFRVKEWLARGPDSFALALIERIEPALTGWDLSRSFSRIFNSTQTVRDMAATLDFYTRVLGFKQFLHNDGSSAGASENVLGLPHNLVADTPHSIYMLHPQGEGTGSVELIDFPELQGRDFTHRAMPPNLGTLALRFPASGLDDLRQRLESESIPCRVTASPISVPPYGEVTVLATQAPEGAWLEFCEGPDFPKAK